MGMGGIARPRQRERASAALTNSDDLVAGCHISPITRPEHPSQVTFYDRSTGPQTQKPQAFETGATTSKSRGHEICPACQQHVSRAATPSGAGVGESDRPPCRPSLLAPPSPPSGPACRRSGLVSWVNSANTLKQSRYVCMHIGMGWTRPPRWPSDAAQQMQNVQRHGVCFLGLRGL